MQSCWDNAHGAKAKMLAIALRLMVGLWHPGLFPLLSGLQLMLGIIQNTIIISATLGYAYIYMFYLGFQAFASSNGTALAFQ
jgi:hypothetical protein